jgi:hypothetical protein
LPSGRLVGRRLTALPLVRGDAVERDPTTVWLNVGVDCKPYTRGKQR